MTSTQASISKRHMKADYVEACNCDFGCPCNFNCFSTDGFCRAFTLYHIQAGSYGDIKLDNLDVITAFSWPKAIHQGNGTVQLFITNKSNEQQRNSISTIFSGKAKGDGPFLIFASTCKYFLEPQFVDIKAKIDGKKSSFSIPDITDVQVESFVNPVTGEEQDTKIQLRVYLHPT